MCGCVFFFGLFVVGWCVFGWTGLMIGRALMRVGVCFFIYR